MFNEAKKYPESSSPLGSHDDQNVLAFSPCSFISKTLKLKGYPLIPESFIIIKLSPFS